MNLARDDNHIGTAVKVIRVGVAGKDAISQASASFLGRQQEHTDRSSHARSLSVGFGASPGCDRRRLCGSGAQKELRSSSVCDHACAGPCPVSCSWGCKSESTGRMTAASGSSKPARAADNRLLFNPIARSLSGPSKQKRDLQENLVAVLRSHNCIAARSRPGYRVHAVLIGPLRFPHLFRESDAVLNKQLASVFALAHDGRIADPCYVPGFPWPSRTVCRCAVHNG